MTKKLESLFNLPPAPTMWTTETLPQDDEVNKAQLEIIESQSLLRAADEAIDKIDIALPTVTDLDTSDKDLDELSDLARDTFTSLIDLSMNVEPRFSGPILQSASTLLGHAITAKVAKIDKKLKMVNLQLQKAKLDAIKDNKSPVEKAVEGEGVVIDRNSLLREFFAATRDQTKK